MLLYIFCVIFGFLALFCRKAATEATSVQPTVLPPQTPSESLQINYTRKQLAAITKRFTNYYLYFGEFSNTVRDNGGLPVGMCFPVNYPNATHRLLSTSVTSSVRKAFVNRVLTRDQVSWKEKSADKAKKVVPTENNTSPASSVPPTPTPSETDEKSSEENEKDKNNKIHNHLVFVMLLPNHPYSQDLRKIITTVSPMFPQTMVVLGNAYEFKDMTTKYYVSSYPKILYFRSGIFIESFDGAYTAEDVAAQFADWTYSLPRAIPTPFTHTKLAHRTANTIRKLDIYAPDGHMRLGLALHPLPLTVPYLLFNITIPDWLAAYLPASYRTTSNITTKLDSIAIDSTHSITSSDTNAGITETTNVHTATTMESGTSIEGSSGELLPATEITLSSEQSSTTSEAAQFSLQATTTRPSPSTNDATAPTTPTTHTTHTIQYEDISIQVSVVVPMPNVEPFLGSLENYAVWDTRLFLVAGSYVIIRVFYLLLRWVRSARR